MMEISYVSCFEVYNISQHTHKSGNVGRDTRIYRVAQKNACFSNNCNFVYFQYKKIISTPKQPVINAVLITYINYSITEHYIGKMASFLPYTRPELLLEVLHHIY